MSRTRAFIHNRCPAHVQRTAALLESNLNHWEATPDDKTRPYVGIMLQYQVIRPWEAAALAYIWQGDAAQVAAVNVLQNARVARAARWAVIVAALSIPVSIGVTLLLTNAAPPVVVVETQIRP